MANLRHLNESIDKLKHLSQVIKSGFDLTSRVGEDTDADTARQLREVMLKYAAMERQLKDNLKAAEDSKREFERDIAKENEQTPDFYGQFQEKVASITSKNNPAELEQHKRVKDYDATIMKQHFGGGESQEAASGEENDDDEIQMTQTEDPQRFICPITKVELVDPFKNICGHVYSRNAIRTHIKNNKNRNCHCPVAGCVHLVTSDTIEEDVVLAYEIRQKHKTN